MAGKYLTLDEAAAKLGVSPDELIEMRSRGDVHGYRDGASWKFKVEEIDRAIGELDLAIINVDADELMGLSGIDAESGNSDIQNEPGFEETKSSSTVIGSKEADASPSDLQADSGLVLGEASSDVDLGGSDVEAISDLELAPSSGNSGIGIADSGVDVTSGGSDVALVPSDDGSDIALVPTDSDVKLSESASDAGDLELGESDMDDDVIGSDLSLGSESGVDDDAISDISLGSDVSLGSDALNLADGSDLQLGDDDDDDLVLGGSGVGSDVSLSAEDTGIGLLTPSSESGLSLEEEPLELEGSSASSLELPEDDEVISLSGVIGDPDEATQLKADEDFQLSPSDDRALDESDSGSQVIALEDSEAFDQDAATMLRPTEAALLADDPEGGFPDDPAAAGGAAMGGAAGGAAAATMPAQMAAAHGPAELPEAPYSVWNVLGLMCIVLVLSVTGMLMVDVVRNMWAWDSASETSTSLMDAICNGLGLNQ